MISMTKNSILPVLLAMSISFSVAAAPQNVGAKPAETKAAPAKPKTGADKPADKSPDADKSDKNDKPGDKAAADKAAADKKEPPKPEVVIENVVPVKTDDLVEKPHDFLGKNVKFNCAFVAFSNLGLDYKPAFRSSKTHISFLVSKAKKQIPLSELKLAMTIPKDKDPDTTLLANLKEGDSIEITGKVFSSALDDPWLEVLRLKKLGGDDKKADVTAKAKTGDAKGSSDKINETKAPETKPDKDKGSKP